MNKKCVFLIGILLILVSLLWGSLLGPYAGHHPPQRLRSVIYAGAGSLAASRQATCQGTLKHGFQVLLINDGHSNYRRDAGKVIRSWNQKMAGLEVKLVTTREFLEGLTKSPDSVP